MASMQFRPIDAWLRVARQLIALIVPSLATLAAMPETTDGHDLRSNWLILHSHLCGARVILFRQLSPGDELEAALHMKEGDRKIDKAIANLGKAVDGWSIASLRVRGNWTC